MNISPVQSKIAASAQYNKRIANNDNYPIEPLSLQKTPSPSFGGVYDKCVEGVAKNYYGRIMQSKTMKWFGNKTKNLNMVTLCATVNSAIISTLYVLRTLFNEKLDPERRTTLAINDGITFLVSTILSYLIDSGLNNKWAQVTHNYTAVQLDKTPEELNKLINDANEKLYYEELRTAAIKRANEALPEGAAKIPLKKNIELLLKDADNNMTEEARQSLMKNVNKLIEETNENLSQNYKLSLLEVKEGKTPDFLEKTYDLLNSQQAQENKDFKDKIINIIKDNNTKLTEGKKIPLKEDIEIAIETANRFLSKENKVPTIDSIKEMIANTNKYLPKNSKIKTDKIITNAEDYVRDVLKNKTLNFKIKGMGIVKSLFVFGMIFRYVVPVCIMKPANKIGAKLNNSQAQRNQQIQMLKEFAAREAELKAYEEKIRLLKSENSAPSSEAELIITEYANAS